MDLHTWRRSLAALTAPGGWIGTHDLVADLAREALDEVDSQGFIGHWFEAQAAEDGRHAKPDAAYRASGLRDAALRLAVVRGLMRHAASGADSMAKLVQRVLRAAMEAPTGLRARSVDSPSGAYQPADFARSQAAATFFECLVRPKLHDLDSAFGTDLADLAPQRYDSGAEQSIEAWGRVWTLSAALIPISWVKAQGCADVRSVARALWAGRDPLGRGLPAFYVRGGTLPTSGRLPDGHERLQVHAELRLRPMLAQLIEGRDEWRALPPDAWCAIHIPLKAIDYVTTMIGTIQRVHYRGRGVFQLYLAVLADALLGEDVDADIRAARLPGTALAAGGRSSIGPAHEAALRQFERDNSTQAPPPMASRSLRSASAPAPGVSDTSNAELRSTWVVRLRHRPQVASGRRWQELGILDLGPHFEALAGGVDWLCVASASARRTVLPITVEHEKPDDPDGSGSSVCLILDTLDEHEVPELDTLRLVLRRDLGATLAVRTCGGWTFVVLEFHV